MAVDISGIKTLYNKEDILIKLPFRMQIVGPSGELLVHMLMTPTRYAF